MASVVTSLGTGSGLPLDTLLTNLMTAETVPLTKLQNKEAVAQSKISAYGSLSSAISTLSTAVANLTTTKFNGGTASSADATIATATATNVASKGSFSLEVVKLALAEKAVSAPLTGTDAAVKAGTLTFTFGSVVNGSFEANSAGTTKDVVIPADATLAGVRDAVNKANIGISASLVTDSTGTRLLFSSSETGAANSFQISGADDAPTGAGTSLANFSYDPSTAPSYDAGTTATAMSRLQASTDAQIKVDGLAITSPSNSVTDAIDGVTLSLVKLGTTKVTVTQDASTARTTLQSLVSAYNTFRSTANSLSLNAPSTSLGVASSSNGPLAGDSLVRDIMSKVRNEIFAPVDGATGQYTSLASLGVSFQADGTLKRDTTTFDKAMAADPTGVANLFADAPNGEGSQGISKRFVATLATMLGDDGAIQSRVDGLDSTTKTLQSQQATLTLQLAQIQTRYQKQFVALDQLVTSMNSTASFLTQQLESLASLRDS